MSAFLSRTAFNSHVKQENSRTETPAVESGILSLWATWLLKLDILTEQQASR